MTEKREGKHHLGKDMTFGFKPIVKVVINNGALYNHIDIGKLPVLHQLREFLEILAHPDKIKSENLPAFIIATEVTLVGKSTV